MSTSWGICEAFSDHAAEAPILEQMAAQGQQTVFAASGDSGSSDCVEQSPAAGPPLVGAAVDDPASRAARDRRRRADRRQPQRPERVGVERLRVEPQLPGNAGGGGISAVGTRPAWQVAPGTPTGNARGAHARLVPDLSVMGDPSTGMLYYQGPGPGGWQAIGGTSMGAPLLAALDAVAAQSCSVATFGFLNPLLYAMGRHGGDFVDVTSGNNAIAQSTWAAHEYVAGPGYDMASGLGSPNPATFLPALCDGPATATATPSTPSTSSLWQLSFHSGSTAYPVGATITVTAPTGTVLPRNASSWQVPRRRARAPRRPSRGRPTRTATRSSTSRCSRSPTPSTPSRWWTSTRWA